MARDKPYSWTKEQLESSQPNIKVIFSKDISLGHYDDLPRAFRHTFLIRHPYLVFDSRKRTITRGFKNESDKMSLFEQPSLFIPGGSFYKEQYDLYLYVNEKFESNPIIIDTDDLLKNPAGIMKAYCEAVGIPFSNDLLKWKAGRDCMDNQWMTAKEHIACHNIGGHHRETFESTCFGNPRKVPDRSDLDADVLHKSDISMKYYNDMYANRLRV